MSEPPPLSSAEAVDWFGDQVPDNWFGSLETLVDRDEILVIGTIDGPGEELAGADPDDGSREKRELALIDEFRERTRDQRIGVASRAEARFGRKVSWATRCGATTAAFTHLSVPVMTRLRMTERTTLDTLVAAGVARSRSDALGWCVRQVAEHESDWLAELRQAIDTVDSVRARRPR